jgi:hypothetical protein
MGNPKKIVIIAGPNGAGKTSFAREFLPREADCPDFINVVTSWIVYDNAGPLPVPIASGDNP